MTNDPGNEIRSRFRATPLPPAPVRLHERAAAVSTSPGAIRQPRLAGTRLVLSFAAVLAVGSVALLAGGGIDGPDPSPSALTAETTPEATGETSPDTTAVPYPFEVICEEAEAPAFTCPEIVEAVLNLLGVNPEPIAMIEVTRPCDTPCLPAARSVKFVITFASTHVMDGSLGPGGVSQLLSSETSVPTECPELEPPAPTCRNYSDD